ncbi:MAG: tetratricopeptide repeat protein [Capsulimonadales bacterium]|nr:tetratricopeptide repeat protein [Capsulimonadales bacterium]
MVQQSVGPNILRKIALPVGLAAVLVCGWTLAGYLRNRDLNRHFDRAEAFVRERKGPEAEAEWLAVVKADPDNVAARELLAEYYLSHQDWQKGVEAFRRLATLAPTKPHVLCKQAACLLRVDNQVEAIDVSREELKRDPDCVTALGLITSLMAQRPGIDAKQQLEYLRRLARLQPEDVDIQRMYVEMLANQYLYDEMRPAIAQLLKVRPDDPQGFNLLGTADLARADQPQGAKDAVVWFRKSLAVTEKTGQANGGAHFGLGRAYLSLRQPERAIPELENAIRILPNIARVTKELANAYQAGGMPEKAAIARKRFLEMERIAGDERMLVVRSSTYPDNPEYPRRLGELYLRTNDPERADYYLRKAAKLRPEDAGIRALLARAEKLAAERAKNRPIAP